MPSTSGRGALRRYYRERADRAAQLVTELAQLPYGDYVLISRRTPADVQADAERDYAAVRPAVGQLHDSGARRGSDRGGEGGELRRQAEVARQAQAEAAGRLLGH